MDNWDRVTPNLEFDVERTYQRSGRMILCYSVPESFESGVYYTPPKIDPERLLFVVSLPDEESAVMLMKDLYYGEYTGA